MGESTDQEIQVGVKFAVNVMAVTGAVRFGKQEGEGRMNLRRMPRGLRSILLFLSFCMVGSVAGVLFVDVG